MSEIIALTRVPESRKFPALGRPHAADASINGRYGELVDMGPTMSNPGQRNIAALEQRLLIENLVLGHHATADAGIQSRIMELLRYGQTLIISHTYLHEPPRIVPIARKPTQTTLISPADPNEPSQSDPVAQLRVKRLARIQAAFGLPLQTLADILKVSRAQVYKWLDESNTVAPQQEKAKRLAVMESLAEQWIDKSSTPLFRLMREPIAGGGTVLDLLGSETIDEQTIGRTFVELAAKLGQRPKSLGARMREAGFQRRPSFRSLPSDE